MARDPALGSDGGGALLPVRRHRALLRDGAWVIVVSVVIAVLVAIAVSVVLPRRWTATATLYVGQSLTEPSFDYGGLLASQLLTPTYARLATATDLLEAVATTLDLDEEPESLAERIEVDAPAGGTLITIGGTAASPEDAAALANAVASELIRRAPAERVDQVGLEEALADVDAELASARQTLLELLALPSLTTGQENTVAQLEPRLEALASTRASLIDELASRSPNALTLIDPARAPASPAGPSRTIIVAVAGVSAAAVAALFVYAIASLRRPHDDMVEGASAAHS
jgi:uncharacterized protein involved in exopolysaccharide biosynthesis